MILIFRFVLLELIALFQGIGVGIIPALGPVLKSTHYHYLTMIQYALLIIPFVVGGKVAALVAGALLRRLGVLFFLIVSVAALTIGFLLLAASDLPNLQKGGRFFLLNCAELGIGLGFGALIPSLSVLSKEKVGFSRSMFLTFIFAAISLGALLSPLCVAYGIKIHLWWVLFPLFGFGALLALFFLDESDLFAEKEASIATRGSFSFFFLFLYLSIYILGLVEGSLVNWLPIFLEKFRGASTQEADIVLFILMGFVTAGRIWFGLLMRYLNFHLFYLLLPVVLAVGVILLFFKALSPFYFVAAIIGLGLSALLPLTITYSITIQENISPLSLGILFAFYLFGVGFGNFLIAGEEWLPFFVGGLGILSLAIFVLHLVTTLLIRRPSPN